MVLKIRLCLISLVFVVSRFFDRLGVFHGSKASRHLMSYVQLSAVLDNLNLLLMSRILLVLCNYIAIACCYPFWPVCPVPMVFLHHFVQALSFFYLQMFPAFFRCRMDSGSKLSLIGYLLVLRCFFASFSRSSADVDLKLMNFVQISQ